MCFENETSNSRGLIFSIAVDCRQLELFNRTEYTGGSGGVQENEAGVPFSFFGKFYTPNHHSFDYILFLIEQCMSLPKISHLLPELKIPQSKYFSI